MNFQLKKRYTDWLAEQVKAGRYASETEAVEEALAAKIDEEELAQLKARLVESERQHADGRYVVADEAFFENKKQMIRDRYMKGGQ